MIINEVMSKLNKQIRDKEIKLDCLNNARSEDIKTLLLLCIAYLAFIPLVFTFFSLFVGVKITLIAAVIVHCIEIPIAGSYFKDWVKKDNIKRVERQLELLKGLREETKEKYKKSKKQAYSKTSDNINLQNFCKKQEQKMNVIGFYGRNHKKLKNAVGKDKLDEYLLQYELSSIQTEYLKSILLEDVNAQVKYSDADTPKKKGRIIKNRIRKK